MDLDAIKRVFDSMGKLADRFDQSDPLVLEIHAARALFEASVKVDALMKSEPGVDKMDAGIRTTELMVNELFVGLTEADQHEICVLTLYSSPAAISSVRKRFKELGIKVQLTDVPDGPALDRVYMQGMDRFLDSGVLNKLSPLQKKILALPPFSVRWR